MLKFTFAVAFALTAVAHAEVWVGEDDAITRYDDAGKLVQTLSGYRRPVALTLDRARNRLWFIDAYDYKLICRDLDRNAEVVRVTGAAHAPAIGATDLKLYLSEKRPVEPTLALDAADGSIWLADFYGHQLAKYDAAGKEVWRTSSFHEPFAVATCGDGFAWVAGSPRTIHLVGPDGKTVITQSGVNEARGLAFDTAPGLLVVADYKNNRVLGVDCQGRLKKKVMGTELPFAVAIDDAGLVWAAGEYAGVYKISLDAEKIVGVVGEEKPTAISPAAGGKLWVAYEAAGAVVCYDAAGNEVTRLSKLKNPKSIVAR